MDKTLEHRKIALTLNRPRALNFLWDQEELFEKDTRAQLSRATVPLNVKKQTTGEFIIQ